MYVELKSDRSQNRLLRQPIIFQRKNQLCFGNDAVDISRKSHEAHFYGQHLFRNEGKLFLQLIDDCDFIINRRKMKKFMKLAGQMLTLFKLQIAFLGQKIQF